LYGDIEEGREGGREGATEGWKKKEAASCTKLKKLRTGRRVEERVKLSYMSRAETKSNTHIHEKRKTEASMQST